MCACAHVCACAHTCVVFGLVPRGICLGLAQEVSTRTPVPGCPCVGQLPLVHTAAAALAQNCYNCACACWHIVKGMYVCVCVCGVCEKERERERARASLHASMAARRRLSCEGQRGDGCKVAAGGGAGSKRKLEEACVDAGGAAKQGARGGGAADTLSDTVAEHGKEGNGSAAAITSPANKPHL